ncbi:MAG TPA: HlyD family efflux transporter periplasmic adaptor subunit [Chloroflexi bacterium]|nr:HlyD family efflux transporter periplasmic adaptor subunit [Chloroflexota bacterium]
MGATRSRDPHRLDDGRFWRLLCRRRCLAFGSGTRWPCRVDQAESALYQAWQRLQLLQSGPLTKTIMQAELEVDRALLAREKARADLEAAVLPASFDGVVLEVNAAPGDRISAGVTLITLMDSTAVEARVTVIEEDLPLIEVGQPVELFVDALPDASLRGQVARIIPQSVPGESLRYPSKFHASSVLSRSERTPSARRSSPGSGRSVGQRNRPRPGLQFRMDR